MLSRLPPFRKVFLGLVEVSFVQVKAGSEVSVSANLVAQLSRYDFLKHRKCEHVVWHAQVSIIGPHHGDHVETSRSD